jgi:hypothetical protein
MYNHKFFLKHFESTFVFFRVETAFHTRVDEGSGSGSDEESVPATTELETATTVGTGNQFYYVH